ncbi:MAG: hypothetical protein WA432_02550 [Candidatus Babeliaceae bacterium]
MKKALIYLPFLTFSIISAMHSSKKITKQQHKHELNMSLSASYKKLAQTNQTDPCKKCIQTNPTDLQQILLNQKRKNLSETKAGRALVVISIQDIMFHPGMHFPHAYNKRLSPSEIYWN